jgi:hypothetical protein
MCLSKADKIAREFAIKEEKLIQGFIAKTSPFVIGVLTTLATLFSLISSKSYPFSCRTLLILRRRVSLDFLPKGENRSKTNL